MFFPPPDAWFTAVNDGDMIAVTRMVQRYAKTMNEHGETGLMCAVKNSDTVLVATLAPHEAGCFHGKNGSTALMQAVARNMADISLILAPYEAALLARKQVSAAMIAAENNATAALCSILSYYQGGQDEDGMTALDYAAKVNAYESAILLAGTRKHSPEQILASSNRASGQTASILVLMANVQSGKGVEIADVLIKYNSLQNKCERMVGALTLLLGADYSEDQGLFSLANAKREEIKKLQISILDREAEINTLQKHYISQLHQHEKNVERELLSSTDVTTLTTELQFYKNRYKEIRESALFKITYPSEEVTGAVCETINADLLYKHKRLESLSSEVERLKESQRILSSPTASPIYRAPLSLTEFDRGRLREPFSGPGDKQYSVLPNISQRISPISTLTTSPRVGMSYSTRT